MEDTDYDFNGSQFTIGRVKSHGGLFVGWYLADGTLVGKEIPYDVAVDLTRSLVDIYMSDKEVPNDNTSN